MARTPAAAARARRCRRARWRRRCRCRPRFIRRRRGPRPGPTPLPPARDWTNYQTPLPGAALPGPATPQPAAVPAPRESAPSAPMWRPAESSRHLQPLERRTAPPARLSTGAPAGVPDRSLAIGRGRCRRRAGDRRADRSRRRHSARGAGVVEEAGAALRRLGARGRRRQARRRAPDRPDAHEDPGVARSPGPRHRDRVPGLSCGAREPSASIARWRCRSCSRSRKRAAPRSRRSLRSGRRIGALPAGGDLARQIARGSAHQWPMSS